jgi:hypothetical protein
MIGGEAIELRLGVDAEITLNALYLHPSRDAARDVARE